MKKRERDGLRAREDMGAREQRTVVSLNKFMSRK